MSKEEKKPLNYISFIELNKNKEKDELIEILYKYYTAENHKSNLNDAYHELLVNKFMSHSSILSAIKEHCKNNIGLAGGCDCRTQENNYQREKVYKEILSMIEEGKNE